MEILNQLKKSEFRFIKIREKEKIPIEPNWQHTNNYSFDSPILKHHTGNVGVVCGFGKLRIIDCDNKNFAEEMLKKLPETFTVKTGSGGLHFYLISDYNTNHVFKKELGEYRAKNYQIIIPPSIHPNGNAYTVFRDKPIMEITAQEIERKLTPYIRPKTVTDILGEGDNTKSGIEFKEVMRLIYKGLTKEEIYERMNSFVKWVRAPNTYKDLTYYKALKYVRTRREKKEGDGGEDIIYVSKIDNKVLYEQIIKDGKGYFVYLENDKPKIIEQIRIDNKTYKPREDKEAYDTQIKAIIIPSGVLNYNSEVELMMEIQQHIRKYVDLPVEFEMFATVYILLTWVYDRLSTIPYLSFMGDTGCGKSRAANVIGGLCYKFCKVAGCITPAPIYRIIRKWGGTLAIEESDFRDSSEKNEVITILNCGFENNNPVIRCEKDKPDALQFLPTYCPKIIIRRKPFNDKALESRCLTQVMQQTGREDIPPVLFECWEEERNVLIQKLLMFRLRNYYKILQSNGGGLRIKGIEPRLKQALDSFTGLFYNFPEIEQIFNKFIKEYNEDLIMERSYTFDGVVIESVLELIDNGLVVIQIKDVIDKLPLNSKGKSYSNITIGKVLKGFGFKNQTCKVDGKVMRGLKWDNKIIPILKQRYLGVEQKDLEDESGKGQENEKMGEVTGNGLVTGCIGIPPSVLVTSDEKDDDIDNNNNNFYVSTHMQPVTSCYPLPFVREKQEKRTITGLSQNPKTQPVTNLLPVTFFDEEQKNTKGTYYDLIAVLKITELPKEDVLKLYQEKDVKNLLSEGLIMEFRDKNGIMCYQWLGEKQ